MNNLASAETASTKVAVASTEVTPVKAKKHKKRPISKLFLRLSRGSKLVIQVSFPIGGYLILMAFSPGAANIVGFTLLIYTLALWLGGEEDRVEGEK